MTDQPENTKQTPCAMPSVSFEKVFEDELEAIDRQGKRDQLVGLAFSGGGIRSATFNLGVLQALAAEGLLSRFDYLSTVSGGGYIGGWLSAWIHRTVLPEPSDGLDSVPATASAEEAQEQNLHALEKVSDQLCALPEPRPIAHLREFSNFLTPRRGLFSMDTLSWITMYICNLQLSLVTVVGLLMAAIMTVWLALPKWASTRLWAVSNPTAVIASTIALLALCVTIFGVNFAANTNPNTSKDTDVDQDGRRDNEPSRRVLRIPSRVVGWWNSGTRHFLAWVRTPAGIVWAALLPAMVAAGLFSIWGNWLLLASDSDGCELADGVKYPLSSWLDKLPNDVFGMFMIATFTGVLYTLMWAAGWKLGNLADSTSSEQVENKRSWLVSGAFLSGTVGAIELYYATRFACKSGLLTDPTNQWIGAVFSISIIALIVSQVIVLHIGLVGRHFQALEREWWARLGAWWLVLALCWTGLFVVVLLGPPVLQWSGAWARNALSISWIVSVTGGILAGKSARSGENGNRLLNGIARIVPFITAGGFVLIATVVLQRVAIGAVVGQPKWPSGEPELVPFVRAYLDWVGTSDKDVLLTPWIVIVLGAIILGIRGNINLFSLHAPYRLRLARCYLGASRDPILRTRNEDQFAGFVAGDDVFLPRLAQRIGSRNKPGPLVAQRPYPLINSALNIVSGNQLRWQQRKAAAFLFSPLYCGFGFPLDAFSGPNGPTRGYADSRQYMSANKPLDYSTAMTISGAAASPNMGFHSSPAMTFLMSIFNVRLGRWCPNTIDSTAPQSRGILSRAVSAMRQRLQLANPKSRIDPPSTLFYVIRELFGLTNAESKYVYLSDGGHFENLGLYELVRRRCRTIVVCDVGADPKYAFNDLGNAIRKCYVDFGATIEIDLSRLRPDPGTRQSRRCFAIGHIRYSGPGQPFGDLIVIKPCLTAHTSAGLVNYLAIEKNFPQVTTADQWFAEDQFESYRLLGRECAVLLLKDAKARKIHGLEPMPRESTPRVVKLP